MLPARSPLDLAELRTIVQRSTRALPFTPAQTGLAAIDEALGGGLPRRRLTELVGKRSAGRTSFLLAVLAAATQRGEAVALVDVAGMLDVRSAAAAGLVLERLLWVCPRNLGPGPEDTPPGRQREGEWLRRGLRAAELILAAGGFGLVALDTGEGLPRVADATWLRLARGAERSAPPGAVLLVASASRAAGSFAAVGLELERGRVLYSRSHASLGPDAGEACGERRPEGLSGSMRVNGAPMDVERMPRLAAGAGARSREAPPPLVRGRAVSLKVARSKLGTPPGTVPVTWRLR
ncbi:MAG TPA: hypothetical protein VH877_04695 [Polyangia bacterium]|jgi:hypothetical protein|nr:hypothetical protein [Polyangia bacterium]